MRIDRKDGTVVGLTLLVGGVFVATHEGWGVPLVGESHRWAAVIILMLALVGGALSAPGSEPRSYLLASLLVAAFLFAVLALATASLTPLSLLVIVVLALIVTSIARHLRGGRARPITT
jgi:hypothetical protein